MDGKISMNARNIINIVLAILVVISALGAVAWHYQSYALHQKVQQIWGERMKILSTNRELKVRYAEEKSAATIEKKARESLQMTMPQKTRRLDEAAADENKNENEN